jgi:hypothetical protein
MLNRRRERTVLLEIQIKAMTYKTKTQRRTRVFILLKCITA